MVFVEAPAFTRRLSDYLDDDEFARMQAALISNPERGDVISGTGGFRKMRWADARRAKGKRGGLRVIYYWFEGDDEIWLMTLYDKNEANDLSAEQKRALKAAIEAERKTREISKRRGR